MSRRLAFTLIELLVVIAIIAVLIALVATRRAGRPARRPVAYQCVNNLKQIRHRAPQLPPVNTSFPVGFYLSQSLPDPLAGLNPDRESRTCTCAYLNLAQLSPYLEQTAVYNAVNFAWPIAPGIGASGPFAGYPRVQALPRLHYYRDHRQGLASSSALSDGATPPGNHARRQKGIFGPSNYHFSTGDGQPGSGHVGDAGNPNNGAQPADGAFVLGPAQSLASILDGSSNTAAASEQLIGPAVRHRDKHRRRDSSAVRPPPDRRLCDNNAATRQRAGRRLQWHDRRLAARQRLRVVGWRLSKLALQPLPDTQLQGL